jgi:hypothetical protein
MNIFFFSSAKDGAKKLLLRVLSMIIPKDKITMIGNSDELEAQLKQRMDDRALMVLFAKSRSELMKLISLKKLFGDMRIILILYDHDENTTAMGYKLRPRFMTYADSDFLDVAAVLGRMDFKAKLDSPEDKLMS